MAGLPPVSLGAIILTAFAAAFFLRRLLEKRVVTSADGVSQPKRQFLLDFSLSFGAGVIGAALNIVVHGFPELSTLSLIYGTAIYGFFIALDMALARERTVILNALAQNTVLPPQKRLFSMTRRFSMVAVAAVICVSIVNLSVIARDMSWLTTVGSDPAATREAILSVTYEILFIMAVLLGLAVNLIASYSRNLKLLFENETNVLERVSNGDLSRMVPVATRDEFGLIAGHTNSMIAGLRHRLQLLDALKLAEEVQRTLLPAGPPKVAGVSLSGTSIYCYEIGGDYYDYLRLPEGRLGIVVADVSGHGIDAALFMTAARAFMISAAQGFRSPAGLVREVNRHLTRDSAPTSQFMSLFFLEIDPARKTLRWVRAGHEPAVVFNPVTGAFSELGGDGMALGVVEEVDYRQYTQAGWDPGTVIVIGTDGISETRNPSGEFFGSARLRDVIRDHAAKPVDRIQSAVIEAVQDFRGKSPQEDDVTLVVVKLV
jgi:sigma-B regulation protein RsbU (phosphoserine phosphatase)